MTEPTDTAARQQALDRIVATLESAQMQVDSADWAAHDRLILDLVDAGQKVYLRTDFYTGELAESRIVPDPGVRMPLGTVAAFLEPLVQMLEDQTSSITPPSFEAPAWSAWLERLDAYRDALDTSRTLKSPEAERLLWVRVALPLALGIFPDDFAQIGISDPHRRSPPDMIYPTTVAFQSAIDRQAARDNWQAFLSDLVNNAHELWDTVTAPLVAGAKALLPLAILAGGVAAYLYYQSNREQEGNT